MCGTQTHRWLHSVSRLFLSHRVSGTASETVALFHICSDSDLRVAVLWVALLQASSTSSLRIRADAYSNAKNIFFFHLLRSTVGSTSTGPKVWWRYCSISSPGRTRAPTRLSCGTAAPKTSLLWCLLIKVRYPHSDYKKIVGLSRDEGRQQTSLLYDFNRIVHNSPRSFKPRDVKMFESHMIIIKEKSQNPRRQKASIIVVAVLDNVSGHRSNNCDPAISFSSQCFDDISTTSFHLTCALFLMLSVSVSPFLMLSVSVSEFRQTMALADAKRRDHQRKSGTASLRWWEKLCDSSVRRSQCPRRLFVQTHNLSAIQSPREPESPPNTFCLLQDR